MVNEDNLDELTVGIFCVTFKYSSMALTLSTVSCRNCCFTALDMVLAGQVILPTYSQKLPDPVL